MYLGIAMPERIASTMITAISSISVKARATDVRDATLMGCSVKRVCGVDPKARTRLSARPGDDLPGVLAEGVAVGPELAGGGVVVPAIGAGDRGRRRPGRGRDVRRGGARDVRVGRDGLLHHTGGAEGLDLGQGGPGGRAGQGAVGVEVRHRRARRAQRALAG